MTEIWEFPTGNYTIFVLLSVVCMILLITSYLAHTTDVDEISRVSEVLYIQDGILPKDPIYAVCLNIDDCFVRSGSTTDLIFRLRGLTKNGPLLLFRDYDGRIENCSAINIGFSVPFDLGELVAVEIAADNNESDEGSSVFSFSDLFVRYLPRKATVLSNRNTKAILRSGRTPFEALADYVRTWTSEGTLAFTKGIRIVGIPITRQGRVRTVRAREAPIELTLIEEKASDKAAARIGFRPLHYIWSQFRSWHDEWSDYSQLDQQMTVCLDLLATLVAVCCSFAFGVERFIGAYWVASNLSGSEGSSTGRVLTIEEFDLVGMLSDVKDYVIPLIVIIYIAFIANAVVILLSMIWSRLFRMIGGKGFEEALDRAQSTSPHGRDKKMRYGVPRFSARHGKSSSTLKDEAVEGSSIILRTLEVKNTYTASSSTTTRQLTMEPLIANCPPDHITARSVAYIRTKMTRLRNESIPSGQTGLKQREVLHESHTQSTDAPIVPPPSTPDGTGEVFRVSRFCERLVQQDIRKIHDNSVIAECFEIVPDGQTSSVSHISASFPDKRGTDFDPCCSKQCCQDKMKPEESLSDMTFFTEEDAQSVQEMVDHMPFGTKGTTSKNDLLSPEQQGFDGWNIPQPSGKQVAKIRSKTFKNSSSSPRQSTTSTKQTSKRIVRGGIKVLPDAAQKELNEKKQRFSKEKKRKVTFSERQYAFDRKSRNKKTSTSLDRKSKTILHKKKRKSLRRGKDTEKPPRQRVPTPSSRPNVFYDPVAASMADLTSKKLGFMSGPPRQEELAQRAPFKGFKVKMSVFICLALLQIAEICFVTAFPMSGNKFFVKNEDGSSGEGAARMACALLSSLIALVWYPLFTVHVIAFLSYLIESIRAKISAHYARRQQAESVTSFPYILEP